jgi:hypothetical protein
MLQQLCREKTMDLENQIQAAVQQPKRKLDKQQKTRLESCIVTGA